MSNVKIQIPNEIQISNVKTKNKNLEFGLCHLFEIWTLAFEIDVEGEVAHRENPLRFYAGYGVVSGNELFHVIGLQRKTIIKANIYDLNNAWQRPLSF